MDLHTWLADRGITDAAFAHRVKTSQATISRIRRGLNVPLPALYFRIHSATKGEVNALDLYEAWRKSKRRAKRAAA